MTQTLVHRGPNDEGYVLGRWTDATASPRAGDDTPAAVRQASFAFCPKADLRTAEGEGWTVGFGHRRLAILDLSPGGHQPMASPDENLWITYNGEIYNYLEIRQELQALGYPFRTHSDTEVILAAYQEWGSECLSRFNGMWAFALWDRRKHRLFCARDRFGVKPFYYHWDGARFLFASEIKALLAAGIARRANEALIYDYLKFGVVDHTAETFFEGVKKLPAGHCLVLEEDAGPVLRRFWDLQISDAIQDGRADADWAEEYRTLLTDAVRLRLRADVAVGACLSGGLDSSSIVCLAIRLLNEPGMGGARSLQTFSACFEERPLDERAYIHAVSAAATVPEHLLYPTREDFLRDFDLLLAHQDEPFNGTGLYAQWCVLKAARETNVPVLLDGQGADEALAGYHKFMFFYFTKLWHRHCYRRLGREMAGFFLSWDLLRNLPLAQGLRYLRWGRQVATPTRLFRLEFARRYADRICALGFSGDLGQRMKEDLFLYSLPALLRYEDRNSMAHSVEARLPFLDVRLAECVARMPLNQKMRDGISKHVLRQALAGILPERVRRRRGKLGFSTPERRWIRALLATRPLMDGKREPFIRQFVDPACLGIASGASPGLSPLMDKCRFRVHLLQRWAEMRLGA